MNNLIEILPIPATMLTFFFAYLAGIRAKHPISVFIVILWSWKAAIANDPQLFIFPSFLILLSLWLSSKEFKRFSHKKTKSPEQGK